MEMFLFFFFFYFFLLFLLIFLKLLLWWVFSQNMDNCKECLKYGILCESLTIHCFVGGGVYFYYCFGFFYGYL